MDLPRIELSIETPLVYVLRRSGCRGRLTIGHVELQGLHLNVYDQYGSLVDYVSGDALRSCCVFDNAGIPMRGWTAISPEDVLAILSHLRGPGAADD